LSIELIRERSEEDKFHLTRDGLFIVSAYYRYAQLADNLHFFNPSSIPHCLNIDLTCQLA